MPWPHAAGDLILASDLNALAPDGVIAFASYTPVLTATTTNPTLGTGSVQVGRYYRVGKLVVAQGRITFGTSGVAAGGGTYRISLPVQMAADWVTHILPCGVGRVWDSSSGTSRLVYSSPGDSTNTDLLGEFGLVTATVPWGWAASDWMLFSLYYQAA